MDCLEGGRLWKPSTPITQPWLVICGSRDAEQMPIPTNSFRPLRRPTTSPSPIGSSPAPKPSQPGPLRLRADVETAASPPSAYEPLTTETLVGMALLVLSAIGAFVSVLLVAKAIVWLVWR